MTAYEQDYSDRLARRVNILAAERNRARAWVNFLAWLAAIGWTLFAALLLRMVTP